jgi:two-component system phosphate regulon response regulator PhoB
VAGHQPLVAFSIERANTMIEHERPQAILLRWKLPDASGSQFINDLRLRSASRLPVIVLGEVGAGNEECVSALDTGADDYVKSPYSIREVLARMQGLLRVNEHQKVRHVISFESLELDYDARMVCARIGQTTDEIRLKLTGPCCRLLRFFLENPLKVHSRKDIIDNVWHGKSVREGAVDVNISLLRRSLAPLQQSLAIQTVRGAGFCLSSASCMPTNQGAGRQANERTTPGARRGGRKPAGTERLRDSAARNRPVWLSDIHAAVEEIRHLQAQLQTITMENDLLREVAKICKA